MTKLGFTNYVLQWFFIRLTKHQETIIVSPYVTDISFQTGFHRFGDILDVEWYSIQYWILPLTGWWSDFIYLNKKPRFLKISKKKEI